MFHRNVVRITATMAAICGVAWAFARDDKQTGTGDKPSTSPSARPAAPTCDANAAFEKLKKLAGTWVDADAKGDDAKPVSVFRVTAAGSAVVETLFPSQDHEMITVYHLDGDSLMLTHYCAAGNQPRMRASRFVDGKLKMDFAGATNLKSDKDTHMHDALLTFVDDDHFQSEWTHYIQGKADSSVKFNLVRRKESAK